MRRITSIALGAVAALAAAVLPGTAANAADLNQANIVGSFDSASFVPGTGIVLSGWALDLNHPTSNDLFLDISWTIGSKAYDHESEDLHVDEPRPDIARAYPDAGPDHGFTWVIGFNDSGVYNYCVSAASRHYLYDGADHDEDFQKPLGCRSVTMPTEKITGALEKLAPNPSGPGLLATGWAADNYGYDTETRANGDTVPLYNGDATLTVTPDPVDGGLPPRPVTYTQNFESTATHRTGVGSNQALEISDVISGVKYPTVNFVAGTYKLCVAIESVQDILGPAAQSIGCAQTHLLAFAPADPDNPDPQVTGVEHLGETITVQPLELNPAPTSQGVQWFRDAEFGTPLATGSSYKITAADVGHSLVVVSWAAASGYASAAVEDVPYTDPEGDYATIAGLSSVRTGGADRYATAVAVSKQEFPSSTAHVGTVYLASGANFPDALSAGPAAAAAGGPALLTDPASLPASVKTELKRLHPNRIVIVGGTSAVSAAVQQAAAAIATTVRLAGVDRYATAIAVARYAFPHGASGAYVASGAAFPDALSAGAAAGTAHEPVLLTSPGSSSAVSSVRSELRALGAKKATIVGGTAAVSSAVFSAISGTVPTTRLAGADRDATSLAVAKNAFTSASTVYLASDRNFPDGLTASAAAGNRAGPLLVFNGIVGCVPTAVISRIAALGATRVVVAGGPAVMPAGALRPYACD